MAAGARISKASKVLAGVHECCIYSKRCDLKKPWKLSQNLLCLLCLLFCLLKKGWSTEYIEIIERKIILFNVSKFGKLFFIFGCQGVASATDQT